MTVSYTPTRRTPIMTTQNIHADRILILDFGSQYTQLIARRVREAGVYSELYGWDVDAEQIRNFKPKGIILSGGPETVTADEAPFANPLVFPQFSILDPETTFTLPERQVVNGIADAEFVITQNFSSEGVDRNILSCRKQG